MRKNDPHTKKVIRLFKWFLKCHGVVDEYKSLLKKENVGYGWVPIIAADRLIRKAFLFPLHDAINWHNLDIKWREICHAFNL